MTAPSLSGRKVLLIVGGGIAAYKALELIRLLKKADAPYSAAPDALRRWPKVGARSFCCAQ